MGEEDKKVAMTLKKPHSNEEPYADNAERLSMNAHCCGHVYEALHALASMRPGNSMAKPRSNNTNAQQFSSSLQQQSIKPKSGTRQYFHLINGRCGSKSFQTLFYHLDRANY